MLSSAADSHTGKNDNQPRGALSKWTVIGSTSPFLSSCGLCGIHSTRDMLTRKIKGPFLVRIGAIAVST